MQTPGCQHRNRWQDEAEGTATLMRQVKHGDLFFVSPRRPRLGSGTLAWLPSLLLWSGPVPLSYVTLRDLGLFLMVGMGGRLFLTTAAEAGGSENVPMALVMLTHWLLSHETLPQSLPLTPLPSGP